MNEYKYQSSEGIKFVSTQWLLECFIEGQVVKEENFLISLIENDKKDK